MCIVRTCDNCGKIKQFQKWLKFSQISKRNRKKMKKLYLAGKLRIDNILCPDCRPK